MEPRNRHFIAAFESIGAAESYIQEVMPLIPQELNIYDARMFKTAAEDPALFAPKFNKGYFVLAGFDDKPRKVTKKLKKCLALLPQNAAAVFETDDNTTDFQRFYSAITSFLNNDVRGERVAITDDFYVPSDHLANFLTDLRQMEKTYNQILPVYGSFSTSNYSVRPDIQLNTVEGRQMVINFVKDLNSLLEEHGGSLTGGAPEGRLKAMVTNENLTEEEVELYNKIKDIFDPAKIFNPEIKLGAISSSTIRHLRTSYADEIIT